MTASSFSDSLFAPPVSRLVASPSAPSSLYPRTFSSRLIFLPDHPPPSRDLSYSLHVSFFFSLSCLLLSYLFILRPRASGRFNVRDFFSPSLIPVPVLSLASPFRPPRSRTPARFAMFARSNASPVCATVRQDPRNFALASLSRHSSFISNCSLKNDSWFFVAGFFLSNLLSLKR